MGSVNGLGDTDSPGGVHGDADCNWPAFVSRPDRDLAAPQVAPMARGNVVHYGHYGRLRQVGQSTATQPVRLPTVDFRA
jgi:hypothetical protein